MLKLERSKKNNDITISLRRDNRPFNKVWWFALFLALFFHFFAFLLFQIHPFKIASEYIFPHIFVENNFESDVSPLLMSKASSYDYFPMPPAPAPNLSLNNHLPMVISPLSHDSLNFDESSVYSDFFDLPFSSSSKISQYSPIDLKISGNLISLKDQDPFISNLLKGKWTHEGKGVLKYYRASYKVQILPDEGRIYWYNKESSTGEELIDKWIEENILPHLKFSESSHYDLVDGFVEITFAIESTKSLIDTITQKINNRGNYD